MDTYLNLTQEEWGWFYTLIAGQLVHNPNRPEHTFTSEKHLVRYRRNYANRITSNTPDKHGYALVRVLVDGKKLVGYRHKVVWLLTYGWLPPSGYKLLHVDGNKLNDVADNLAMYETANPSPKLIIQAQKG